MAVTTVGGVKECSGCDKSERNRMEGLRPKGQLKFLLTGMRLVMITMTRRFSSEATMANLVDYFRTEAAADQQTDICADTGQLAKYKPV